MNGVEGEVLLARYRAVSDGLLDWEPIAEVMTDREMKAAVRQAVGSEHWDRLDEALLKGVRRWRSRLKEAEGKVNAWVFAEADGGRRHAAIARQMGWPVERVSRVVKNRRAVLRRASRKMNAQAQGAEEVA